MAHLSYSVGGDSNLVSFKSAARAPIDSLKVHFKPIQEGTGDPSPENVRPITGWTGVTINNTLNPVISTSNAEWTDGYINTAGGIGQPSAGMHEVTSQYIPVKAGQTYVFNYELTVVPYTYYWACIGWFKEDKYTFIERTTLNAQAQKYDITREAPAEAAYARISFRSFDAIKTVSFAETPRATVPVEFYGKNLCPAATGTEIGQNWSYNQYNHYKVIDNLIPNHQYTLQCTVTKTLNSSSQNRLYLVGKSSGFMDLAQENVPKALSVTVYSLDDGTITVQLNNAFSLDNERAPYLTNIQLELGSTATAYEPYNNTFYGGYVDIAKGELVVDREKRTIQSFSGAWGATNNGYAVFTSLSKRNWDIAQCNQFTKSSSSYSSMPLYSFLGGSGVDLTWTFILPSTVTSKAEADAWLANLSTPLEVVCPLDTPITYQLTPTELSTLLSTNNIWSNANDVTEVSYAVHDSAMIRAAKRRMAMAANSRDSLPAPYRRVEYIGAEGANPYIDTGMRVTAELECDIRYYNDKQEAFLFGARNGVSSGNYCNFNIDGSVDQSRFDYASIKGVGDLNLTGVHDGEYTLSFHNRQFSITNVSTGVTLNRDYSSATFSSLNWRNLYLFAVNTNGTLSLGSTEGALRIYSGKIWIGGKLAADYIPCVRKADDKPGMYDTVTRTFLTSANSDEFVYGEKGDYLANVEWVEGSYIGQTGGIDNSSIFKYSKYPIVLPPGEYELHGISGTTSATYFRIHEYTENDTWVKQITYKLYDANAEVSMSFVAPNAPNGVKVSIQTTFVGTLKKK